MADETLKRELIPVSGHEVVRQVPRRERPSPLMVERIDNVGDARRRVDRLTKGVGQHHVQPAAGVPEAGLKCIVCGVAETSLEIVVAEVRSEWPARPVDYLSRGRYIGRIFGERATGSGTQCNGARLTQRKAKSWVAWIGR